MKRKQSESEKIFQSENTKSAAGKYNTENIKKIQTQIQIFCSKTFIELQAKYTFRPLIFYFEYMFKTKTWPGLDPYISSTL